MKKYFVLFFVLAPVVFFILWMSTLSLNVSNGTLVQVPLRGYDPRDLLSGHYIQYTIDPAFDRQAYPECKLPKSWRAQRFYIPEESAATLDQIFHSNDHQFSILFSCNSGRKAIAKQLLIDNQDWHQFIEKR